MEAVCRSGQGSHGVIIRGMKFRSRNGNGKTWYEAIIMAHTRNDGGSR